MDAKCSKCGNKLSQYELMDNIYAGLNNDTYICYPCQINDDEDLEIDIEEEF